MKLTPTQFGGAAAVDGYGPGFFRINGKVIHGAVLVTAEGGAPWAGLDDRASLLALAGRVDVLFIGMGADVAHAPADLVAALRNAGVAVESMASPTAARTYNVTLSEGRRVACALLPL
ncbi:Mth938-like domain-containing protein [Paracoccus shandongensis]|uniref:Mth938-like domain-containing protein n=1 Tax=Paracoccus shandongensis TaxID=2816048 RepID=UPI001A901BD3|nr:Mth938-like domain-containing protein [Paracoccus shandongensis]